MKPESLETLTHMRRSTFKNCRRLFYNKHELRLVPVLDRAPRRRGHAFGHAIWAALEAMEQGWGPLEINEFVRDDLTESYSEARASSQEQQDEIEFEQHALQVLVLAYLDRYPAKQRREVEFSLPLINPRTNRKSRSFVLGGKIDGLEILGKSHARIIEDKLVSQITPMVISKLTLDDQVTEYVDALISKGWTAEVAYRHTRWPSIRRRKGETTDQFCERFSEDLKERTDWYFSETKIVFPLDHMEEYRLGRWQVAKDILQARKLGEHAFYLNPSHCGEWGGCVFIPKCVNQLGWEDLYRVEEEDNPELSREEQDASSAAS